MLDIRNIAKHRKNLAGRLRSETSLMLSGKVRESRKHALFVPVSWTVCGIGLQVALYVRRPIFCRAMGCSCSLQKTMIWNHTPHNGNVHHGLYGWPLLGFNPWLSIWMTARVQICSQMTMFVSLILLLFLTFVINWIGNILNEVCFTWFIWFMAC